MLNSPVQLLVDAIAATHGLDRFLLTAQVIHESGGIPWATRFERGYRWTFPPSEPRTIVAIPPCSSDTEEVCQKTSWGLLQIMGATARELGYREPFLSRLAVDASIALDLGCQYLLRQIDRHGGVERALAAYNAGSPTLEAMERYAIPILTRAEDLRVEDDRLRDLSGAGQT